MQILLDILGEGRCGLRHRRAFQASFCSELFHVGPSDTCWCSHDEYSSDRSKYRLDKRLESLKNESCTAEHKDAWTKHQ